MEKSATWRTMFPEFQEERIVTPRKRVINDAVVKNYKSSVFGGKEEVVMAKTPQRGQKMNFLSEDNPLNQTAVVKVKEKFIRPSKNNKESNENPFSYKVKNVKSERIIKGKVTESHVSCLPASVKEVEPVRVVKTRNSESCFDFLPGAFHPKPLPVKKNLVKNLNIKNQRCFDEEPKVSCKKLQTNKLDHHFTINTQFEL